MPTYLHLQRMALRQMTLFSLAVIALFSAQAAHATVDDISGTMTSTYRLVNNVQCDHVVLAVSGQLISGHKFRTKGVGYEGVHQYARFLDANMNTISTRDTEVLNVDAFGPLDPEQDFSVDVPEPLNNVPPGTKWVQWNYYTNLQSYIPSTGVVTSQWGLTTDVQAGMIL